jgi:hypothetical protein
MVIGIGSNLPAVVAVSGSEPVSEAVPTAVNPSDMHLVNNGEVTNL